MSSESKSEELANLERTLFEMADEEKSSLQPVYLDSSEDINNQSKECKEAQTFDPIKISPSQRPLTTNGFLHKFSSSTFKTETMKRFAAVSSDPNVFYDPVFGLRIVRPLVSSITFKERMEGKIAVGVQRIRFHTERGDVSKDWVIAGVLVSKSEARQTQKGNSFSIWQISDLKGDVKLVSVFMFRSAHKELWKTSVGTVVGILNPKILERKNDNFEAVLSVENHQQVMILGQSKDIGKCRAKKSNGEICKAPINKSDSEVCIYHMKREYNKVKRSEFQSASQGRGFETLRNQLLGKSGKFYANQAFNALIPAKKSEKHIKQDQNRMMTLSASYQEENPSGSRLSSDSKPFKRPGAAASLELNVLQRKKDLERLKLLQGTDAPQMIFSKHLQEVVTEPPKQDANFVPKLSDGNLTFTLSIPTQKILKMRPLELNNTNLGKYRETEAGKKRLLQDLSTSPQESEEIDTKKVKLLDAEETKRRKEYLLKMMNATSSHANLVHDKEAERREKVFDSMERKEETEMKCKAVICRRCKYISFSASALCKEKHHELKVVDAVKRFYECGDCRTRTVTLFQVPRDSCSNCRSGNWKRAGMIEEAFVGEQLSKEGIK